MKKLLSVIIICTLASCAKEQPATKPLPTPFQTYVDGSDKEGRVLETSQTFYFKN